MIANLLYAFALILLSPVILYRCVRYGRYRRGWRQKLFGVSPELASELLLGGNETECIWLHAVSVGEVNLLQGVLEGLRQRCPGLPIVISSSTDTGYDLAVSKYGSERVFFCPLDFSWAVRRSIRNLRPAVLVLAELELWPNLIRHARGYDAEVLVVNGRLSDRSAAGYQRFSWLTSTAFRWISRVECQDDSSARNFIACGTPPQNVSVSGSLKFDGAPQSRAGVEVQSRTRWAGVDPWQVVWVVGSTQEGEEQMALDIYRRLSEKHAELRLILVPRHPERFNRVSELIASSGLVAHRRSADGSQQHLDWTSDRVILVDTIGELRHWWGVGQIATVGGSFGNRGGQNMLEPAGYGNAVSFGPNTKNFAEIARGLLDAGGAVRVADADQLEAFVTRCLTDRPAADALGRSAQQVIRQHRGATERTVDSLIQLIRVETVLGRAA